jgi:oligoribonuclease
VKPDVNPSAPLIWLDLETSGLAPGSRILEIAVQVTDGQLRSITPISSQKHCTIWMQDWDIEQMEPYARDMHQGSGLLKECCADRCDFVHEVNAENWLLDCLAQHGIEPKTAPLAGASVHFDRRVLAERMPKLHAFLHYRNVDISTVRELAARWRPDLAAGEPAKRNMHRALPDLEDSLSIARYYREHLFAAEA